MNKITNSKSWIKLSIQNRENKITNSKSWIKLLIEDHE